MRRDIVNSDAAASGSRPARRAASPTRSPDVGAPKVLVNNFLRELAEVNLGRRSSKTSSIADLNEYEYRTKENSFVTTQLEEENQKRNGGLSPTQSGKNRNGRARGRRGRTKRRNGELNYSDSTDSSDDDMSISNYRPDSSPGHHGYVYADTAAWDIFEKHIINIDTNPDTFAKQPRKIFGSSNSFQQVMTDTCGNSEYGVSSGYTKFKGKVGNLTSLASRLSKKLKSVQDRSELDLTNYTEQPEEPDPQTVENAKHAWSTIRRYIQELRMERKNNNSTFNWAIIQHHLKQRSNMERARTDLYERYGVIPVLGSDGTFTKKNTMLSERAREMQARVEERRRVFVDEPGRGHTAIGRNRTNRPKTGFRSAKSPERKRPVTHHESVGYRSRNKPPSSAKTA